jgi:predicted Zn finger-like uncharacterized protein
MKIVCDACQAKYSISDDKVQGKVFKIRCKKCSNIIVVRGGAGAAEPAPAPQQEKDTRVYDYGYEGGDHAPAGDDSVWHVVINQDQVGPMTAVEVQHRFSSGEIDSETYIWREGFTDWLPLAQVDAFSALVSSGATAVQGGGGADAVASMFGGGGGEDASSVRSDPGDLFAAASRPAHHDDDGGDLFGAKPAAAPSSQASSKLRGERNENSVLFSLNNLAQLASDKPAPAPSHSPSASQSSMGAASGAAGGEGSGLIDIRSMASAYLGGPGGGAAKPASAGIGSIDDLPVFGGGGFSEPAVIVPMAPRANNNKLMYALIGSVGLLAVAAVIVVIVMLKGGNKPPQVASVSPPDKAGETQPDKAMDPGAGSAAVKDPATPPAGAGGTPPVADPRAPGSDPRAGSDPRNPAVTPPPAAKDPAKDPEPKHPAAPAQPIHKTPPPSGAVTAAKLPKPPIDKTSAPAAGKAPAPTAKPDASSKDGCDEVSCVLNNYEGACCAKYKKGGGKPGASGGSPPAAAKAGDLPDGLDRTMISDGVAKVKARVMGCGEKSPVKGTVKVSVRVGPDGHVTSATPRDPVPDAGLASCVAAAMQKATFAKTQNGGSFAYPFVF